MRGTRHVDPCCLQLRSWEDILSLYAKGYEFAKRIDAQVSVRGRPGVFGRVTHAFVGHFFFPFVFFYFFVYLCFSLYAVFVASGSLFVSLPSVFVAFDICDP